MIYTTLEKNRLKKVALKLYYQDFTTIAIAKIVGRSTVTVQKWLKEEIGPRKRGSGKNQPVAEYEKEVEETKRLYKIHKSQRKVGRMLGISQTTVYRRVSPEKYKEVLRRQGMTQMQLNDDYADEEINQLIQEAADERRNNK